VHNRLVADLDESKMELVETQSFATEVTSALAKLKERDVRILLGNFNEFWARRIFCEAYRFGLYGRKYQWIIIGTYTRDWWLHPDGECNIRELSAALHGVILVDLLPLTNEGQHTTSGIVSEPRGWIELRRAVGSRLKPRGSPRAGGGEALAEWVAGCPPRGVGSCRRNHPDPKLESEGSIVRRRSRSRLPYVRSCRTLSVSRRGRRAGMLFLPLLYW
jgi:hypothetical protein